MKYSECPKCGGKLIVEKKTFSGEAIREYTCLKCGWCDEESLGTAMWKRLSDLEEKPEDE